MVYQGFDKVVILPKREFTLDLAEKPPWWKLGGVYPQRFSPLFYKTTPFKISESFT